ncbi:MULTISPECIES: hypothetical protein [Methylomonas]|uniref:hypothetical protein n=1 Tax=Methylomonas TaxID=416 RepID=UPI000AF5FE53|nr:hypothetical protein [Methylomonas koyamae]
MKTAFFRPLNLGLALALSLCRLNSAHASASYDSIVALSYSIGILDSTNPTAGDRTGLSILGTYQQANDEFSFYANAAGDGTYLANSPNPSASAVASLFNGSFAVSGNAYDGSVDTWHTGQFGLELSNAGPYRYDLSITLDYALRAAVDGAFATSAILFDYWDAADQLSGSDYSAAASFAGQLQDQQSAAGSAVWTFTLVPGATVGLYAQAGIESHLTSTAPVPLPAAIWLFGGTCLGWIGFSRARTAFATGKV